jgi:FAD:protein FMN transferase
MVQVGGCVAVLGRRPEGGPWQVAVQHPRNPDAYLAVVPLEAGAIDTAGDYQRYFMQDGIRYHHILDPRTGAPARGVASVTVLGAAGRDADAAATAALVLGMAEGYRYLVAQGFEAILVSSEGEAVVTPGLAGRVDVEVGQWAH